MTSKTGTYKSVDIVLGNILYLLWDRLDLLFQEDPRALKVLKISNSAKNCKQLVDFIKIFNLQEHRRFLGNLAYQVFLVHPVRSMHNKI